MFLLSQAAFLSSGVLHKPNSALKPLTARWKTAGTFSIFLTAILRDTEPVKLQYEAVQVRLHLTVLFTSGKHG